MKRGLPSSWRRYWFPPWSLASDQASPSSLSQNSTTLFLSSCTQVPSELTTWHTNNTLYPHSHAGHLTHWRSCWLTKINSSPCYTSWNYLRISKSIACKHSIQMIRTKPTAVHHMTRILISAVTEKSDAAKFKKNKNITIRQKQHTER